MAAMEAALGSEFMKILTHALLAGAMLFAPATMAVAQDEEKAVSFTGGATFVSDYRFRGVSFSDKDIAVQGAMEMGTTMGFYVGLWGSSIADFNGATAEVDLYAGWRGEVGPVTLDGGILGYFYPGGTGTDIYELYGSVGGTVGPVGLKVGLNWAPDQGNLTGSNRYLYFGANAGIPNTPISVKGNLGFERGSLVVDETGSTTSKTDWLIGVDVKFEPLTIGFAYTDTDLPGNFSGIQPGVGGPLPGADANSFSGGAFIVSLGVSF